MMTMGGDRMDEDAVSPGARADAGWDVCALDESEFVETVTDGV